MRVSSYYSVVTTVYGFDIETLFIRNIKLNGWQYLVTAGMMAHVVKRVVGAQDA